MESGSILPVTIVIVALIVTVLIGIVGCLGLCLRLRSAKQVHSAGPGPLTGRWRGERTSPTQLQPCQPLLYQPGPVLPPTYNTVMGNSCEYPTVSHGEEAPDGTVPPPREMTPCQMA